MVGLAVLLVGTAALGASLYKNVSATLAKHPSARNFYGVLRVFEEDAIEGGTIRRLQHGAIMHGAQFVDGDRRADPITYYGPTSGVGLAVGVLRERPNLRIGVVGLGVGTMAAFGRAGDAVRFYEIDPAVRDVARSRFTYLGDSKAAVEVVLGDARLSLEREPPQRFDLLALDAFSSDAIPVHLLTREAFEVYQRHLKPDGVLAVHVSNRHLDLAPVVHRLAEALGFDSELIKDMPDAADEASDMSEWVLLARDARLLDAPSIKAAARPKPAGTAGVRPWTDDDTNLYQTLQPWDDGNPFAFLKFW
jgi:SAM-dependent methyltransferase